VDFHCSGDRKAAESGRPTALFYRHDVACQSPYDTEAQRLRSEVRPYPSFALIVIFAFSTFDTGHPFSAASAYF